MQELDIKQLYTTCKTVLSPTLKQAYNILFSENPSLLFKESFDVDPNLIADFAKKHYEIYKEQAIKLVTEGITPITVIRSGMFGGKTTLAFLIEDALRADGKKVKNVIAASMGEDYVTARSYPGKKQRKAFRYGGENYKEQIHKLVQDPADIIILDECSFEPTYEIADLISACKTYGKSIILTGLDTNFLGDKLPLFRTDSPLYTFDNIQEITCNSFVPGVCEDEPHGTSTARYARVCINNTPVWVYDMGIYPLVVSKEHTQYVHYIPVTQEQTANAILSPYPDVREKILNPTDEETFTRISFLNEVLSNKI